METKFIYVDYDLMKATFIKKLLDCGFTNEKAKICATVLADNSLEGVNSHGVNRFCRLVDYINRGLVKTDGDTELKFSYGAIEQWHGHQGPGIINALNSTQRAMDLAGDYGIGCVGLAHTNHWMRGGTYGRKAAKNGFIFIGWTNTIANMPAWGARDNRLGNNPLVISVPFGEEAIVLDMAMSQYSIGTIEEYQLQGRLLPFPGGLDQEGKPTNNPGDILKTRHVLPAGYWKGTGLSLLLDILATILSGGISTKEISKGNDEFRVSQVFMAFDISKLNNFNTIHEMVMGIIEDIKSSVPNNKGQVIRYPGEKSNEEKEINLKRGIPVQSSIWEEIISL
ncbi:MAG: 3-dehydro-L-gulonate 2-dehydrogenase [Chitinophagaceae bacterium]